MLKLRVPFSHSQPKLIWLMLLLSGVGHMLLLWASTWTLAPLPQQPIIHARLKAKVAQPSLLHTQAEPTATASTEASPPPPRLPKAPAKNSGLKPLQPKANPVPKPKATAAQKPKPAPAPLEKNGLVLQADQEPIDPLEQHYQQLLLAHLRQKVSAPYELNGSVRLAIKFSYRQIATEVSVIRSSGNAAVDDWALKAVLSANPYPPVPNELPADFIFRPTIEIAPN